MPLDQQRRVEAECGEGGEAAEDPRRQEQTNVLRNAGAISEIAGKEAHQKRARDIHDQGSKGKTIAEQPRRTDVHSVAQRTTQTGTKEHNQIKHKPPTAAELRM